MQRRTWACTRADGRHHHHRRAALRRFVGFVALCAHAKGSTSALTMPGLSPLIGNRTSAGLRVTSRLIHTANGSVSFQARVNND